MLLAPVSACHLQRDSPSELGKETEMKSHPPRVILTFQFPPELMKPLQSAGKRYGYKVKPAENLLQVTLMLLDLPVTLVLAKVDTKGEHEHIKAAVRRMCPIPVIAVSDVPGLGLTSNEIISRPEDFFDALAAEDMPWAA
jgi:hypothetical protein